MKKFIIVLIALNFGLSSCEKDDLCDTKTATTPRLVIDFYNKTNTNVKKNVTNLSVVGQGKKEGVVFNAGGNEKEQYLANGSTISIPLKNDSNSVTFNFILNTGNTNTNIIDTDQITFNYTRKEVYVSRACGFKTVFELTATNSINHVAVPETKNKWIELISIEKSNIDNENEAHLKIYF